MGNEVTIIVGAGAVLDFDYKGIFPSVPIFSHSAESCRKKKKISLAVKSQKVFIPLHPKSIGRWNKSLAITV